MNAATDSLYMRRALDLARQGEGSVEPNPMVGCVIVQGDQVVGQGFHQSFGGSHAEVHALREAGSRATGATVYVTLEPCSHFGKTPPCAEALIAAGVARVVVAHGDPHASVNGKGLARLREAGISVEVGVEQEAARQLLLPFLNLQLQHRPWVIAKWAMTLDGKLATVSGESQWISGPESRAHAHQTRGRVDAILVGAGTVCADDPLLTARPPGARCAIRVVLDASGRLPTSSQLARTAQQHPVLLAIGPNVSKDKIANWQQQGIDIWRATTNNRVEMIRALILELGQRHMTNVLVEGGARVLGNFLSAGLIDETHVYIANKLVGGEKAPGPIGGGGIAELAHAYPLVPFGPPLRLGSDTLLISRRAESHPPTPPTAAT